MKVLVYIPKKSISTLIQLRVKQSNLKKKEDEENIMVIATANELENTMNANPRTAWKACKEIAASLFGHHKSTVSMKMRKQN